jgi:UDP-3-O-[3-hydroxymyristoyl] glucosamine N-acyltransferase
MALTTQEIAEQLGGRLDGPGDLTIDGFEALDRAQPGQITFIGDAGWARQWTDCAASAALVGKGVTVAAGEGRALIWVDDMDRAVAGLLSVFAPQVPQPAPGVHPSATVDESAEVAGDACIGAGCYIGPRAVIGPGAVLQANVVVMDDAKIGAASMLWPGVVVRERCEIGARCVLHPNAVIGADGFGFVPDPDGAGVIKIPQNGYVVLGDDVEIGAGSCVDRGKFSATTVGHGTKVDNLVQIGHNCRIGQYVIIAGCCAIGGSVTIGDGVVMGGNCAIKDHVTIGPRVTLAASSGVIDDIPAGQTWAGLPAQEGRLAVRQHFAERKLPEVLKQLKKRGVLE